MREDRMIAFTDAVLAIIMTILILGLDKPAEMSFDGIWELRRDFFAYCLSFFWLGSVWISLNGIWGNVKRVTMGVVWCNIVFLFFASFLPYATSLVSDNFENSTAQAFYGIVVIATTVSNWVLHKMIDSPNAQNTALLESTKRYRTVLMPDILFKIIALVLAILVYPPCMMYGVLFAAAYMQLTRITFWAKGKHKSRQ